MLTEVQASALLHVPVENIRRALFDLKEKIDAAAGNKILPQVRVHVNAFLYFTFSCMEKIYITIPLDLTLLLFAERWG